MPTQDEHIAQSIRESELSGELRAAKDWGKPLDFGDGYAETPEELRMGYKILKDAGYLPPEVELMKRLAEARSQLSALPAHSMEASSLQREIVDLQLKVTLMRERLPQML
ncbi:MAG: DUF1992 domain-containing protein [Rhodoferax sp.]|nr:DUF1992 domain-containing protein [Rhodoferax sp.]